MDDMYAYANERLGRTGSYTAKVEKVEKTIIIIITPNQKAPQVDDEDEVRARKFWDGQI